MLFARKLWSYTFEVANTYVKVAREKSAQEQEKE